MHNRAGVLQEPQAAEGHVTGTQHFTHNTDQQVALRLCAVSGSWFISQKQNKKIGLGVITGPIVSDSRSLRLFGLHYWSTAVMGINVLHSELLLPLLKPSHLFMSSFIRDSLLNAPSAEDNLIHPALVAMATAQEN